METGRVTKNEFESHVTCTLALFLFGWMWLFLTSHFVTLLAHKQKETNRKTLFSHLRHNLLEKRSRQSKWATPILLFRTILSSRPLRIRSLRQRPTKLTRWPSLYYSPIRCGHGLTWFGRNQGNVRRTGIKRRRQQQRHKKRGRPKSQKQKKIKIKDWNVG